MNDVSEVGPLHEAGATELYCGLMRPEVQKKYTNVFSLNSRHVGEANLAGFEPLRKVIGAAHDRGMKVFVTYNAIYPAEQFDTVVEELESTLETGPDGLIVADIPLISYLHERHPEVRLVISTFGGAFNSHTARLYQSMGASRVTLPRHLTLDEIKTVSDAVPGAGFEVFVMSERCYFPNSLCRFEHASYRVKGGLVSTATNVLRSLLGRRMSFVSGSYNNRLINAVQDRMVSNSGMMCCREYEADLLDAAGGVVESGLPFRFFNTWNNFREACGLCALYDIAAMENVVSVKIVGRQSLTSRKVADTGMVGMALDLLESKPSREEFEKEMKVLRKEYYPHYCGPEYCYYSRPGMDKK